jgi:serine/threonine protein kinase/Tol biopolymer transport system component
MTPERWQRVKGIAVEAMDLAPEQREAYLQTQCGDDEELRQSVEKLLKSDAESGDTFEQAIAGAAQEVHNRSVADGGESFSNQTISHYRITEKLGAGGMGVVYKAEDTKLERAVALKFLAPHLVADENVRRRFHREAKAAAALTHPNIAVIHEIDEVDGHSFIAMEFVEGLTLTDKIAERPLKLSEALDIATQAAQGLQAAHDRGIVHRDIKSANLMLTPRGQVKIMDFGLAQLAERSKLTETTAILGTPSYMSPEQALGEKTDRRTDLWSLGVVLYEMVAGRQPFEGERQEAVLYGITNEEHEPVTALRAGLPMELEWLITKTLAKNREERYQNAEDLLVDLQILKKKVDSGISKTLGASQQLSGVALARSGQQRRRSRIVVVAAVVAGLVLGAAATRLMFGPADTPEAQVRRFSFEPDEPAFKNSPFVISPNGKHVVWSAGSPTPSLWIRDMDSEDQREIEGTEGAATPFWSPDSRLIGFGTTSELRKIDLQGRPPTTLCELPGSYRGGTWSPDGSSIVFGAVPPQSVGRLYKVAAQRGEPEVLFEPEPVSGSFMASPHFLPGSRRLLFSRGNRMSMQIVMRDLETNEEQSLGTGVGAVYSTSGHILCKADLAKPGLWALPFSVETLQAGEKFLIDRDAGIASVATDGTLIYGDVFAKPQELVWRDRAGKKLDQIIGKPLDDMGQPALSPDERRVAVRGEEDGDVDIWIHEVGRPASLRLNSTDNDDVLPHWLPLGEQITFASRPRPTAKGTLVTATYIQPADASGTAEPLLTDATFAGSVIDWSLDGRFALVVRSDKAYDLWYLKQKDDAGGYEPLPYLDTAFSERAGHFSPDARWVVYVSNESGKQQEVFVRSFPERKAIKQVSSNGGGQPIWSRDGQTIFYVKGEWLMAVPVTTEPEFSIIGEPRKLFASSGLPSRRTSPQNYDVSADGQRFVVIEAVETKETELMVRVVENWSADFKN